MTFWLSNCSEFSQNPYDLSKKKNSKPFKIIPKIQFLLFSYIMMFISKAFQIIVEVLASL